MAQKRKATRPYNPAGWNKAFEGQRERNPDGSIKSGLQPALIQKLVRDAEFELVYDAQIAQKNNISALTLKKWLRIGRAADSVDPHRSFSEQWDAALARMEARVLKEIHAQGFGKKKTKTKHPGQANYLIAFLKMRFPHRYNVDGSGGMSLYCFESLDPGLSQERQALKALSNPTPELIDLIRKSGIINKIQDMDVAKDVMEELEDLGSPMETED